MGINRNIVECKSTSVRQTRSMEHRINRNIVECKYEKMLELYKEFLVLIETLWNVNLTSGAVQHRSTQY